MYLGGVDKIGISPDWMTDRTTDRIPESQKKIKNVYELVINKKSGKLKYAK